MTQFSRAFAAESGVTVEVNIEQEQFLPNEDIVVAVRIVNFSGQTLHLGKDADWLTFTVDGKESLVVSKLEDPVVMGEFSLGSSLAGIKRINLTPCFDFRRTGRYTVKATVKIPQWEKEISSAPRKFEIINGTKLKELQFGLPKSNSGNSDPEVRKYILQLATYLKQNKLYLRVTDGAGEKTFKVFLIALVPSFNDPDMQLDKNSNLHLLNQTGRALFCIAK